MFERELSEHKLNMIGTMSGPSNPVVRNELKRCYAEIDRQRAQVKVLKELFDEAYDIINYHLPAYDVWLEKAEKQIGVGDV